MALALPHTMKLFTPVALGDLSLPNRLVMAPLTRLRADEHGVPGEIIAEHYAQRASAGLIVTEGTFLDPESKAYPGQPGIWTEEQIAGWSRVTEAVHARGGRIAVQLMHGGRVSHTEVTGTERIVAPSAIAIDGEVRTPSGKQPYPVPHALTTDEAAGVVDIFVTAARNAMRAGFDGVQVHTANGYLLHQFLAPSSNTRDDRYGGSPENRARLPIEVTRAVAAAIGAGRTGMRISPERNIVNVMETEPAETEATYAALAEGLAPLGLAFLDVLHPEPGGQLVQGLRRRFAGPVIANTGFATPTERHEALAIADNDEAEAVAVGRGIIANPDLVERWSGGHPENPLDMTTIYAAGDPARGYTDYPTLEQLRSA